MWLLFASFWYGISYFHGDIACAQYFNSFKTCNECTVSPRYIKENQHLFRNQDMTCDSLKAHGVKFFSEEYTNKTFYGLTRQEPWEFEIRNVEEKTACTKDVCVLGIHNFMTAFLFSIETQTTLGYGRKYVTVNCKKSILLFRVWVKTSYLSKFLKVLMHD